MGFRSSRRVRALVVGAGVLVAVEVLLRMTVRPELLTFSYERPNGILLADPGAGTWLPRPLAEAVLPDGPNHWGYRMNAQGLREDEEVARTRPEGTLRYLALGDSWIWGQSTDQSATLDRNLEALLPLRNGGVRVEVINGGVPGAGAYDMLLRWRDLGARFELDGLILGAPQNLGRQRGVREERALFLSGGGAPYVDLYLYLGLRRLLLPLTRAHLRDLDDDVWTDILSDLATIATEAHARGLSVVLGLWPQSRALATGGDPKVPYARVSAALPGVALTGARLGSPTCWGFEDHTHPSEVGYRVLALVLSERMTGGPDPRALRATPRCEDTPGIGPGRPTPPRPRPPGSVDSKPR